VRNQSPTGRTLHWHFGTWLRKKKNLKRLIVWKRLSKLNGRCWYWSSQSSLQSIFRVLWTKQNRHRIQFCRIIRPKSMQNQSPTGRTLHWHFGTWIILGLRQIDAQTRQLIYKISMLQIMTKILLGWKNLS
jgi:hypothetical protein